AEVDVVNGDSAKAIAQKVNNVSEQTGVSASARTTAQLSISQASTVSFTLFGEGGYGTGTTGSQISANVTDPNDLSGLAAAINAKSGTTGISAASYGDHIELVSATGDDIAFDNFQVGTTGTTATVTEYDAAGALGTGDDLTGTNTGLIVAGHVKFASS